MFSCTVCGECCRQVKLAEETKSFDRGDGTCRHFNDHTKQCNIYDERPLICRVDAMFDNHYHKTMTRSEFYRLNAVCCNILQDKAGLDVAYRIDMSSYDLCAYECEIG